MAWRSGLARPPTQWSGWFGAGVAEHLRARGHALPELLRERGERSLVHAERAQAVPGEGHRHPALVLSIEARIAAADCTVSRSPRASARPPPGCGTTETRSAP